MNTAPEYHHIVALAPEATELDPERSAATLERILAEPAPARRRRTHLRKRAIAVVAGGALALTAGTAIAGVGPGGVVRDALTDSVHQPNSTSSGAGTIGVPHLVAKFQAPQGLFAVWVATSSTGAVCVAHTDGTWNGHGIPDRSDLDYGCGGMIVDPSDPDHVIDLKRADQIGGFFKDEGGPVVYGVSPYPDAARVHVKGAGVDRTLPVRADSHGYGAALPGASDAKSVRLTFVDAEGGVLGSRTLVAPVG